MRTGSAVPVAAAVLALVLAGCSSSAAPGPDASSSTSSAPSSDSSPGTAAPDPGAVPASVTADGVTLDVPEGWDGSTTSEADRAAALERVADPDAAGLLRQRFEVLGTQGGIMTVYDLRQASAARASVVEVYRYPAGATTEQVVPALEERYEAIQTPVTQTEVQLPAGPAVLLDAVPPVPGQVPRTQVYLVTIGPSLVALNVIDNADSPDVAAVVASARAA